MRGKNVSRRKYCRLGIYVYESFLVVERNFFSQRSGIEKSQRTEIFGRTVRLFLGNNTRSHVHTHIPDVFARLQRATYCS